MFVFYLGLPHVKLLYCPTESTCRMFSVCEVALLKRLTILYNYNVNDSDAFWSIHRFMFM